MGSPSRELIKGRTLVLCSDANGSEDEPPSSIPGYFHGYACDTKNIPAILHECENTQALNWW